MVHNAAGCLHTGPVSVSSPPLVFLPGLSQPSLLDRTYRADWISFLIDWVSLCLKKRALQPRPSGCDNLAVNLTSMHPTVGNCVALTRSLFRSLACILDRVGFGYRDQMRRSRWFEELCCHYHHRVDIEWLSIVTNYSFTNALTDILRRNSLRSICNITIQMLNWAHWKISHCVKRLEVLYERSDARIMWKCNCTHYNNWCVFITVQSVKVASFLCGPHHFL